MTPVQVLVASLKSRKTTLGGLLSAAGLLLSLAGGQVETGLDLGEIGQVATAVGVLVMGLFGRDANVTSRESLLPR